MGISELREGGFGHEEGTAQFPRDGLGRDLVRRGIISGSDAALADLVQRRCDTSLDRVLLAEGLAREDDLLTAHARRLEARRIDEAALAEMTPVETGLDPRVLLRHGALVLRDGHGMPRIVSDGAESLAPLRARTRAKAAGDGVRRPAHGCG